MSTTLTFTGTLRILKCGECHIPHAIPAEMYEDRLQNGGDWYCPNGHKLHFITTESEKLKAQLKQAQNSAHWARVSERAARDQAHAAERSARAYKGHVTRLKNRIANGVCPVAGCQRSFSNVRAHIRGQHPEWAHEHPEALS